MPCFSPVSGWRGPGGMLTQNARAAVSPVPLTIPCGGCIGCRVTKTSEWAARAVLELRSFPESCFITLTYAPEKLPPNGTLYPPHLSAFWKRLRIGETRRIRREAKAKGFPRPVAPVIRYFSCGEYGEKYQRPHYHAVVFGYRPADGVVHKQTPFGPLYSSSELSKHWLDQGFVTFGDVSFESCAYVASYVQKKFTGDKAIAEYGSDLWPPFARMSTKPGLGIEAAYSLQPEMHDDKLWLGGTRYSPVPRYMMEILKVSNSGLYDSIKLRRKTAALDPGAQLHQTYDRLKVREEVFTAAINQTHKEVYHGHFQPS